jgi:hypothetical protein
MYFGSVSDISVHGHLALVFLGLGKEEHHGGSIATAICSPHGEKRATNDLVPPTSPLPPPANSPMRLQAS